MIYLSIFIENYIVLELLYFIEPICLLIFIININIYLVKIDDIFMVLYNLN